MEATVDAGGTRGNGLRTAKLTACDATRRRRWPGVDLRCRHGVAVAGTVHGVDVLVATAERWGTYHSRYTGPYLAAAGVAAAHLVPTLAGVSPLRVPGVDVREGLGAVASARLLVVGSLPPGSWPAEAAAAAAAAGVPVMLSHLAYLGPSMPRAVGVDLVGATAASPSDAADVAGHLGWGGTGDVLVVGMPALDSVPAYRPQPRSLLVVTSVSRELGQPGRLRAAARIAVAAGWEATVLLHPREDPRAWSGFRVSALGTVDAAASASVALGYPGTVFPALAAVGVPIAMMSDPAIDAAVPEGILRLASRCDEPGNAVDALLAARPADPADVAWVAGPVPGATARLVGAWLGALR